MNIVNIFAKVFPKARSGYAEAAQEILKEKDKIVQAAFLSQTGFESTNYTIFEENLNYSASALLKVFPKYFNQTQANSYARKPEKIANRIYANRMGNGDELSGDGWTFRGRGPIQLTGRYNYEHFTNWTGIDIVSDPDSVLTPEVGMKVALWFWDLLDLDKYAKSENIRMITKRINGGTNGLDYRQQLFERIKQLLGC